MHRIRVSLLYFKEFGWEPEVVTVDPRYSDMVKDELLIQSIPADIKIHTVKAFNKKWTSKLGLGSLGFRSIWYYRQKVNELLKNNKYDLIYFSTTQFPVCILGSYWKKRFNIPYVIDMQDPWYSEYYKYKPKNERPPKYQIVYGLHKILEAKAMKTVDGLISVSEYYINDLKKRYLFLKDVPTATITFGAFKPDLEIAADHHGKFEFLLDSGFKNIVYVGRGGLDMHKAITPVFKALKKGLKDNFELFKKTKFYFIGTSYVVAGSGEPTILPLAKRYGVEDHIVEITDRISYYHTILTLQQADALFIPGSADAKYSASKIYPYLLAKKPLLAIFNKNSNAVVILKESTDKAIILTFDKEIQQPSDTIYKLLSNWGNDLFSPISLTPKFEKYSAKNLTGKQTLLFDQAIQYYAAKNTNA
ncbi:MAG: hypothetical protein JWP44_3648 [Mucilaginibacter sp.]|nr:hypothetical protein [Mucilaginibacter sp.]